MFSIHVDSFYILVGPKWSSKEIQWQIMQKAKREQILFKRTMCGLQPLDVASISQMFKAYLEDKFYSSRLYQLTAKSCWHYKTISKIKIKKRNKIEVQLSGNECMATICILVCISHHNYKYDTCSPQSSKFCYSSANFFLILKVHYIFPHYYIPPKFRIVIIWHPVRSIYFFFFAP